MYAYVGVLILLFFQKCYAFDLDDVEYDKMPPLFSLDNYDRCLLYNGTYCVVKADLYAEPENELMNVIINYTKSSHIVHYNYTYLEKGVCVSTTCKKYITTDLDTPGAVHDVVQDCINSSLYEEYGLQARVSEYYCDTNKEPKPKDIYDWMFLAAVVAIVLVNVSATIYHLTLSEEQKKSLTRGERMLLCFSMIHNWRHLVSPVSTDPKIVKLEGINGMRVATSFPMVLGHVMWIYMMGFIDNPHDYEKGFRDPKFQLLYNGMSTVQIFFTISGFLLIYNLENAKEGHKVSWRNIPAIYIHRFFRLAPSLAMMLAFTSTWLRFMGSGPLWNKYVTPVVTDCRKWWWTHLLFINNYISENNYCAIQTWHIAADTQLFFTGIVIYIMSSRRHRMRVLAFIMAVAVIVPALQVYYQDLEAILIQHPEFLRKLEDKNFKGAYVLGHNNISAFVLGMFVAYKLHDWEKKGVVFKGPVYTLIFRCIVFLFISFIFIPNFFQEEDYRTPLWIRMAFFGLYRVMTCLPVAFTIVGFVMGFDRKYLGPLFAWRGFTILGKLTYSVYLLHMNFTPIIAGSKTQLEHLSYLNMMVSQLGIIALTYLISIPFYLMVEAPVNPAIKILLSSKKIEDTSDEISSKSFLTAVTKKKKCDEEEKTKALLDSSIKDSENNKTLLEKSVQNDSTTKKDL